jgi:hypothetical protein
VRATAFTIANHAQSPRLSAEDRIIIPGVQSAKIGTQLDSTLLSLRQIHVSAVYTGKDMSTTTISSGITADEFQALEQKVLRAVEIVKREREARAAAEAEVASLREELDTLKQDARAAETELTTLNKERDAVRVRVEKMLQQIDELL